MIAVDLSKQQELDADPKALQQDRQNGFQSGGAMEHWQVLSVTMVGRPEKYLNSRRSRMAKTVTF